MVWVYTIYGELNEIKSWKYYYIYSWGFGSFF